MRAVQSGGPGSGVFGDGGFLTGSERFGAGWTGGLVSGIVGDCRWWWVEGFGFWSRGFWRGCERKWRRRIGGMVGLGWLVGWRVEIVVGWVGFERIGCGGWWREKDEGGGSGEMR